MLYKIYKLKAFNQRIYKLFLIILYFFLIKFNKKCKPKISIFLPIYNSENYINNCIKSLQNQTLKDIEIILVNDHSSDNSLKKLLGYAKSDKRIKIVNNNKNRGLLYSRAMGILNSRGEYLFNIDSDDELVGNDSLEYLYNQIILSKVDILYFNIFNKKENLLIKL